MADAERLVTFELLGQEYKFYTAASEEEMESILSLVRPLVDSGAGTSTGTLPVSKIAMLACLNIASRYVKLESEFRDYRQETDKRLLRLSKQVKTTLEQEQGEDV